jgi:ethanolamine transporter EutH
MNCPVNMPPAWVFLLALVVGLVFAVGMIRTFGIAGLVITAVILLVVAIFVINYFTGLHAQGC